MNSAREFVKHKSLAEMTHICDNALGQEQDWVTRIVRRNRQIDVQPAYLQVCCLGLHHVMRLMGCCHLRCQHVLYCQLKLSRCYPQRTTVADLQTCTRTATCLYGPSSGGAGLMQGSGRLLVRCQPIGGQLLGSLGAFLQRRYLLSHPRLLLQSRCSTIFTQKLIE